MTWAIVISLIALAISIHAEWRATRADRRSIAADKRAIEAEKRLAISWDREQVKWKIVATRNGREASVVITHDGHQELQSVAVNAESVESVAITSGSLKTWYVRPKQTLRFTMHAPGWNHLPEALELHWVRQDGQTGSGIVPIEYEPAQRGAQPDATATSNED